MNMSSNSFYTDYKKEINHFISQALREDIGDADHTSNSCLDNSQISKAQLVVKEGGIIAGIELAKIIFNNVDEKITFKTKLNDGDSIKKGDIVFIVEGPQTKLLSTERLVLNCMQRMSGIATLTNNLQSKINHTNCTLLDTRKTTPNFRFPEKWAVKIGGGMNHRMGLYDMIMIKDNHVDFNGSLTKTLEKTRHYLEINKLTIPTIVEVRNSSEIKECLNFPWIYRLLLDNMTTDQLIESLALIKGVFPTEASGNITQDTIVEIAETGVDFVSLGALTHSAKNIDLSLKSIRV